MTVEMEPKKQQQQKDDNFTIIQNVGQQFAPKVKRVLPKWLSNPKLIDEENADLDTIKSIEPCFKEILSSNGFTSLLPVQKHLIPFVMRQHELLFLGLRDICVSSPTGSGKTLAFAIPILQLIKNRVNCYVQALVVLPTVELANQVYQVFKTYSACTNLYVRLICGSQSFEEEQKLLVEKRRFNGIISRADIVIATPGRLKDHLQRTEGFHLKHLRFLVIDEADKMMNPEQNHWIKLVEESVYYPEWKLKRVVPYQKFLFSATFTEDPEKLEGFCLAKPMLFTSATNHSDPEKPSHGEFIGKYTTPSTLKELYAHVTIKDKPLAAYCYIKSNNLKKVLCFTMTTEQSKNLHLVFKTLGNIGNVGQFSASLGQIQRKKLMSSFAEGDINVLICTTTLARGLDFKDLNCVILYSPPKHIENYIHCVGRTARAGKEGTGLTLLVGNEKKGFLKMLRKADKTLTSIEIDSQELEDNRNAYKNALSTITHNNKKRKRSSKDSKNSPQKKARTE